MDKIVNEEMLDALREDVRAKMSEKRFLHTLGVEREISRLADIYGAENKTLMRCAALLHDITKEYTPDRHLNIMESCGLDTEYYRTQNHKVYHSVTASLIIPREYEDYADGELIHAVSVHTTGCADMTLFDKLLFLADYIEDTRTFEDCVVLRRFFYDGIERGEDKCAHLEATLLLSFDMTLRDLIESGSVISDKTVEARNSLLYKAKKGE